MARHQQMRLNMRNPLITTALAAGLVIGIAGAASAADQTGPYVGLGVGPNFLNDASTTGPTGTHSADFDTGFAGIGTLGYKFDKNWRTEFELGYRRNEVSNVSGGGGDGDVHSWDYMGNVLYDIDTGSKWTPYVGIGAGAVHYRAAGLQLTPTTTTNDGDTGFAYQGILGVSYDVTPRSQMFLDYRYLRANNPSVTDSSGGNYDTTYRSNTVLLGFRYTLNTGAM
jgi:opacity protein-like surface antigen